jgi:hypothetical protein
MKKKIAADLTSLAHRILQMKNKNDVNLLQAAAKELYEKLTVLAFTENHFGDLAPTAGTKEVQARIEQAFTDAQENVAQAATEVEKVLETSQEEVEGTFASNDLSDLFMPAEDDTREEIELPGISTINKMVLEMPDEVPEVHEVEQQDGASDEATNYESYNPTEKIENEINVEPQFERPIAEPISTPPESNSGIEDSVHESTAKEIEAEDKTSTAVQDLMKALEDKKKYMKNDFEEITADFQNLPVFERKVNNNADKPFSVNDRLNKGLKIGMNDRLGFVKHLFNGSTADFNRVLSQLNTMTTADSAHNFINTMVKPEYNNWDGKDAYADRFMEVVERGFS